LGRVIVLHLATAATIAASFVAALADGLAPKSTMLTGAASIIEYDTFVRLIGLP